MASPPSSSSSPQYYYDLTGDSDDKISACDPTTGPATELPTPAATTQASSTDPSPAKLNSFVCYNPWKEFRPRSDHDTRAEEQWLTGQAEPRGGLPDVRLGDRMPETIDKYFEDHEVVLEKIVWTTQLNRTIAYFLVYMNEIPDQILEDNILSGEEKRVKDVETLRRYKENIRKSAQNWLASIFRNVERGYRRLIGEDLNTGRDIGPVARRIRLCEMFQRQPLLTAYCIFRPLDSGIDFDQIFARHQARTAVSSDYQKLRTYIEMLFLEVAETVFNNSIDVAPLGIKPKPKDSFKYDVIRAWVRSPEVLQLDLPSPMRMPSPMGDTGRRKIDGTRKNKRY